MSVLYVVGWDGAGMCVSAAAYAGYERLKDASINEARCLNEADGRTIFIAGVCGSEDVSSR